MASLRGNMDKESLLSFHSLYSGDRVHVLCDAGLPMALWQQKVQPFLSEVF